MIRLAVLVVALLCSTPVMAIGPSDYVIAESTDTVFYLDPETVKVRRGRLTAWIGSDYIRKTTNGEQSNKMLIAFDCSNEEAGPLITTYFSLPSGAGSVVNNSSYDESVSLEPVLPKSSLEKVLQVVCGIHRHEPIESMEVLSPARLLKIRSDASKKTSVWWLDDKFFSRL